MGSYDFTAITTQGPISFYVYDGDDFAIALANRASEDPATVLIRGRDVQELSDGELALLIQTWLRYSARRRVPTIEWDGCEVAMPFADDIRVTGLEGDYDGIRQDAEYLDTEAADDEGIEDYHSVGARALRLKVA